MAALRALRPAVRALRLAAGGAPPPRAVGTPCTAAILRHCRPAQRALHGGRGALLSGGKPEPQYTSPSPYELLDYRDAFQTPMDVMGETGGSGYASYATAAEVASSSPNVVPVPRVEATAETLRGMATVVPLNGYDAAEVQIVPWPRLKGTRPLAPETGMGGITEGLFTFEWSGRELLAQNHAVGGDYVVGLLPTDVSPSDRTAVLCREANYHPCGGQLVVPTEPGQPFVALLAPPKDDVQLTDFVAFYCDGSFGIHIDAGVWHQPIYPCLDRVTCKNKQGAVHACVVFDSIEEHGQWMLVPLV